MNKTIKSFMTVTGFSVATRLTSFFFKMWMSRSLGAETVGLYQIALSIILLLFSLTAGAPTVLSRKVAGAEGDKRKQNAFVSATLIIGLVVGAVLLIVLYSCHSHLDGLFADDRCVKLFLIMLPTLLTSTLYQSLRSWFWGRKKFLAFSSTEFLEEVVKIVLATCLAGGVVALDGGVAVAIAFTVSDLVCVLVLGVMFFVKGGRICRPAGTKEIIRSTLPLSTMRILTSLSATATALIIPERLVASGMSMSFATAEYGRIAGMAFPLIIAPATVISALAVVLIPDVASLAEKKDYESVKTKLKALLVFSALVSGFFFMLYLPFGKHLGKLFFGDEHAGEFISYCAPMVFPLALNHATSPILNSLGLEKRTFINYIVGAVLMLPCILVLPKFIGVYSVAVGMGVAFTVSAVLSLVSLKKKLGDLCGVGKGLTAVGISLPLGVTAYFLNGILVNFLGYWFSMVVTAFYVIFFFVIGVSAFNIVDVKGYLHLFTPAVSLSTKGKGGGQRLCRLPFKRRSKTLSGPQKPKFRPRLRNNPS